MTQPSHAHLLSHAHGDSAEGGTTLQIDELPDIREIYPGIGTKVGPVETPETALFPSIPVPTEDDLAMYLHSAGSTGLPKPIPLTQQIVSQWTNSRT